MAQRLRAVVAPKEISALDVINAVDGPVVITSCVTNHGNCVGGEQRNQILVLDKLEKL
jgi:DNA-binding IscR family transcriptional regulator